MKKVIFIIAIILISCKRIKSYGDKGFVALVYKEKIYEIEGKHFLEDLNQKVYILFNSIKIKKENVTNLTVQFPEHMYDDYEEELYYEEEYYDEYWSLTEGKETIKITEEYIQDTIP